MVCYEVEFKLNRFKLYANDLLFKGRIVLNHALGDNTHIKHILGQYQEVKTYSYSLDYPLMYNML